MLDVHFAPLPYKKVIFVHDFALQQKVTGGHLCFSSSAAGDVTFTFVYFGNFHVNTHFLRVYRAFFVFLCYLVPGARLLRQVTTREACFLKNTNEDD